jgi:hypothetical protein
VLHRLRYKPFAATAASSHPEQPAAAASAVAPAAAAAASSLRGATPAAEKGDQRSSGSSPLGAAAEGEGEGEKGDPVTKNLEKIRAHNGQAGFGYSLAANRFVHVRPPAFFRCVCSCGCACVGGGMFVCAPCCGRYTRRTHISCLTRRPRPSYPSIHPSIHPHTHTHTHTHSRYAVRARSPSTNDADATHLPFPTYQPRTPTASLPQTLDRREDGMVTPIRDQGTCLGSWAAASAAALETALAVAGAGLAQLSVQRLLDCAAGAGAVETKGCSGGWPLTALGHVRDVEPGGMLPLEEDARYFEVTGTCAAGAGAGAGAAAVAAKNSSSGSGNGGDSGGSAAEEGWRLTEVAVVPRGDEEALAAAVAEHGAVVVTVQAMEDFWLYGGGCVGVVVGVWVDACMDVVDSTTNQTKPNL